MTSVIKQHTENGYYVVMEFVMNKTYKVEVCPCYANGMCGYPVKSMVYALKDEKNAKATFNRYVRIYCKGT